jgi:diketogulonate reductase-like aldo/keto reductase
MSILVQKEKILANGVRMPVMGLGVFKMDNSTTEEVVYNSIKAGIRMIDTATCYQNEQGVGDAVLRTGIPRNELFLTTKLWNTDQGYDSTLKAFDVSMNLLHTDYLDLYLIHWPIPFLDRFVESYRAMERLYKEGRIKAIGVSNFNIPHLERLRSECEITPMVNQIELHPYLTQKMLVDYCAQNQIVVEAWSPLAKGIILNDTVVLDIAARLGKQPSQVVLRWDYQNGIVTIPKSVHTQRIVENTSIFDFELSIEDMLQLDNLNRNQRTGPDPDTFQRMSMV